MFVFSGIEMKHFDVVYLIKFSIFNIRVVQRVRDPKFLITQIECQNMGKRLLIRSGQMHLHLKSGILCRMQNAIHVKMIQFKQSMDRQPIKCRRMTMCRRQISTVMKLRCYRMMTMTSSSIGLFNTQYCSHLTQFNIKNFHLKAKDNAKFVRSRDKRWIIFKCWRFKFRNTGN